MITDAEGNIRRAALQEVVSCEFFIEDFVLQADEMPDDIILSDVEVSCGLKLSAEQL